MRCWCGYLPGARCRLFAYGPADATAMRKPRHSLVAVQSQVNRPDAALQCVLTGSHWQLAIVSRRRSYCIALRADGLIQSVIVAIRIISTDVHCQGSSDWRRLSTPCMCVVLDTHVFSPLHAIPFFLSLLDLCQLNIIFSTQT